ncbi:MAG: sulfatase-like hydrolase/transferase, partial [Anaerolineae bacterium]|nr:sulfatase-like hydrolase/transferase [Anaerolineae bacterium]
MRILYIDIDSMRPDHLSCYGYHRQTSPNIDALAAEGVRFTNFYASDSP